MPRFPRLLATGLVALALVCTVPLRSLAAQGEADKGPSFEHVHALAMDAEGRTLFLGAHTGLFRSEDGGRSWKPVPLATTQAHLDIMAIAPDLRDPRILYVATHERGVFQSRDGGTTWSEVNTCLGGLDVHGVAVDPNVPSKLHAAVREKGEGVYRTTNAGGTTWERQP